MIMEKNSFIVYHKYRDILKDLTNEQVGILFRSIFDYEIDKTLPNLNGELKMAFNFVKTDLDFNSNKYNNICERNRKNGQSGGRPKKEQNDEKPKKPSGLFGNPKNPEKPKKPDNEYDNEYGYDNNNILSELPNINDDKTDIFNHWNSKNIIVHRKFTNSIAKAIEKALKVYSKEEIKALIDRYNTILKDKNWFFDYKWSLEDFLTRKDGISSFTNEGSKWVSYAHRRKTNDTINREATLDSINNLYDNIDDFVKGIG